VDSPVITFGSPAFLLAGALAALVPLALHLIRRRPPGRAPLPTERFLTPDPRTSVRISRPTDVLLLALRMLLLVLAGAGFARPAWIASPEGTSEIVLLDRGAAMSLGNGWATALSVARERLLGADGRSLGEFVLFDTAAVRVPRRRVTTALFDSLAATPPSAAAVRYAAALRAIPVAVNELRGADSVRVTLVTRPRWGGWSDGLTSLRSAVWPGSIDLVALPDLPTPNAAAGDSTEPPRGTAIVVAPGDGSGDFPVAALQAVGWTARAQSPDQPLPGDATLVVVTAPMPPSSVTQAVALARGGATLLATPAAAASLGPVLPWAGRMRVDSAGGAMVFPDGSRLPGAAMRVDGGPAAGASTVAAWQDGRAAAASRRLDRGCILFVSTEIGRGGMVLDAAYPRALDRLARGCESPGDAMPAGAPLDAGGRAVLRGTGTRSVPASAAGAGGGGAPLGRWLMAAALAAALAETFLAYGRKRPA
jgi:hypothetical protein